MIIRHNCFETNSSSTHALCIGKGKLVEPYVLINNFLKETLTKYDTIPKEDEYLKPERNKKIISGNSWFSKKEIVLRRIENLGRRFDIYDSPESKMNFIWTCLISNYNNEKYNCKEMTNKFLEYIFSLNLNVRFLDMIIRDRKFTTKTSQKILCYLDNSSFLPETLKCKYLCGEETYGYYPMEEIIKILKNEKLFWNLILGNSKIYTGSDEEDSFEDLNFENYKFVLVGGSDSNCCCETNIFDYKDEEIIGQYKNGNYTTTIYENGTRTRELNDKESFYEQGLFREDFFKMKEIDIMNPEFPESIDLKITNYCENGCKFCYASSDEEGSHADKEFIKNVISQMRPFTEIAIGGGNPISHPNLEEILKFAKEKKVICNMTLKDIDVIRNSPLILKLYFSDLIKSIGISPTNFELLEQAVESISNVDFIVHFVLGIHKRELIENVLIKDKLKNSVEKVLILGYKEIGRGKLNSSEEITKVNKRISEAKELINELISRFSTDYKTIAFDNLAIKQLDLDVKNKYKDLYQGDDGKFSFYIDAVKEVFAKSSLEEKQNWFFNLDDAFKEIKKGE